ncbi:MAG: hypothetical protein KF864_06290 [Phycisphaeraceae bacterium]|nr:hypothetical protein [Phycisphaeraceae bacterium]
MMLARDIPKPEANGVPTVYAAGDVVRDGVSVGKHTDRRRIRRSVARQRNGRDRCHLPTERWYMMALYLVSMFVVTIMFAGCDASKSYNTYSASQESPVLHFRVLGETGGISVRPIGAMVGSYRDRHSVSMSYEFVQDAAIATDDRTAVAIVYVLYNRETPLYFVDGKQLVQHRFVSSEPVRRAMPQPTFGDVSVGPGGEKIMIAHVPGITYLHRGDITIFDMVIELESVRRQLAQSLKISEESDSVIVSGSEAMWTFVLESSQ